MFFKGSRYANVGDLTRTGSDGREVKYKKVRFTPDTKATSGHIVNNGERLDNIAHRYYRDSERFWRIADANTTLWPSDLTAQAGRVILIPPSEG